MRFWEYYHLAHNVQDALDTLKNAPGPARLIAGGTDLLLDIQQGRHPAVHTLVDVSCIQEMTCLEIRQDHLFIGAAVPLKQIVSDPQVSSHALALCEACRLIGGAQVRNTATLGGNVAHALPAADGTIALLALNAHVEIASRSGRRTLPIEELFVGPGRSILSERQELLVGFSLPVEDTQAGSAFRRVMRPQGVAIAILNMGVWVRRDGNRIADIRVSVGPGSPVPFRAREAENELRSHQFQKSFEERAIQALLHEANFRTSPHRSTSSYRRHLAGVLLAETLSIAWQRTEK